MSYKKDTIEITLTSYGTLDVVSIPVKLYRDSYKAVKIRVNAPIKSGSLVKVYQSDRNEAGEQIWNSATYSIPALQPAKTITINGSEYRVHETFMPQEMCANNGDVNLTFAQVVTTSGQEEIVTSGTLNLYIGGEGYNYAGVQISDYDVLASRVNQVIEQSVNKEDIAELEAKIENSASKDELQEAEDRLNTAIGKVDSDLRAEIADTQSKFVTLDTNQTVSGEKTFNVGDTFAYIKNNGASIQHTANSRTSAVYVDDTVKVGSVDRQGSSFSGITHNPSTYITNVTGNFQYNGKQVATTDQLGQVNATTLSGLVADSDTIVHSVSGDKVQFNLDAEIKSKISKSLVTPMSRPSATELVAVDSTNSQTMVEIGDGLSLENGTLKATGGGATGNFVTTDTYQKITGNKDFVLSSQYSNSKLEVAGDYISISSKRQSQTVVDTNNVFVGDYLTRIGGLNSSFVFSGLEYDAYEHKTKLIGDVEYNGSQIATLSDLEGVSGGGSSVTVVDTLVSQSTTDALSARQGNVLYNMIVDIENSIKTAIQDTWEASY